MKYITHKLGGMSILTSHTLMFRDWVIDFINNHSPPQTIYVGIGTAANLNDKRINVLPDKHNHLLPPIIQRIHKHDPERPLYLIEIDPRLSFPPYIAKDWNQDTDHHNIYHHPQHNIHLYAFREYVHYLPSEYTHSNSEYIYPYLDMLNTFTIENNHLLLVHDFTGRDTYKLAYMFDKHLQNNIDRVVYDITCRFEGTCSMDLFDDTYNYPIQYNEDGHLTVLNPYQMKCKDMVNNVQDNPHIMCLICSVINNKIDIFFRHYFSLYRRLYIYNTKSRFSNYTSKTFLNTIRKNEFQFIDTVHDLDLWSEFLVYKKDAKNADNIPPCEILQIVGELCMVQLIHLVDIYTQGSDSLLEANSLLKLFPDNIYSWKNLVKTHFHQKLKPLGLDLTKGKVFSCYL